MPELFEDDRARLNARQRHAENKARLAHVYGRVRSTGQSTFVFPKPIMFGLTFIEEPFVSHACRIDLDAWDDINDSANEDDPPPLPAVTGWVTSWVQDDRDFYVGAHVGVSVWFPLIDPGAVDPLVPIDSQPVIYHHFTFAAIAMKDIEPGRDVD